MGETVTGGAAVVDALAAHGVRHVFGIPGTHNLEIYRYLPGSGIGHVVTRHEQGAGYAADGYARVTGGPGVIVTTSGPGITNAITALATAYADSVPVLAVSPGPPRGMVRADVGWLHEVKDQQAALDAVTARSIRVESADDVPEIVADVFEGFASTRPRPVHLEVPVDVLEGEWERRAAPVLPSPEPVGVGHPHGKEVARLLREAESPVLVVGGGGRRAAAEVLALAEHGVPVLTTVNGKGVLDETHPASLGASVRLPAAHRVMNDADLLIVVGSELGDSDLWGGVVRPGKPGGTHRRTRRCRAGTDAQERDRRPRRRGRRGRRPACRRRGAPGRRCRSALGRPRAPLGDRRRGRRGRRGVGADPDRAPRGPAARHGRRRRQLAGDLLRHRPPLAVHAAPTGCCTPPATRPWATGCPPPSAPRSPSRSARSSHWSATAP